jgi:hypothetical protein
MFGEEYLRLVAKEVPNDARKFNYSCLPGFEVPDQCSNLRTCSLFNLSGGLLWFNRFAVPVAPHRHFSLPMRSDN